jgi:hypothetical protein
VPRGDVGDNRVLLPFMVTDADDSWLQSCARRTRAQEVSSSALNARPFGTSSHSLSSSTDRTLQSTIAALQLVCMTLSIAWHKQEQSHASGHQCRHTHTSSPLLGFTHGILSLPRATAHPLARDKQLLMPALGLPCPTRARRYCCRRMVLTHVDLIQKLIEYAPLEK